MDEILLQLLHDIATSRDLLSVNIAAGVALEQLRSLAASEEAPSTKATKEE